MLLLVILIISILSFCNSYNLRGSNIYENSLFSQINNSYENSLVNQNNITYENSLVNQNNITYERINDCHPDILTENCNTRALYPYPINTKNYRICYHDIITLDNKNNVYSFVKYHKLDLHLYTYLVYFDGKSAKADIQGWCPLLI
jgi:hypothetical protein